MKAFLEELTWRGLVHDATPALAGRLATGNPITAYVGFDPTGPSLQVGNLVPVMLLSHLQRAGGTAIVVMGGGTGMVGDPSGKSEERPLLTTAELDANVRRQEDQFRHLLPGVEIVDNATWLRPLGMMEFLRDVGKHFTISVMLQKDSVKSRLEQGISFTEFSYMLTQAYDFWHLFRERDCELQMGGSDQWGNITAGVELIRKREGKEAHSLTAPLITTATGAKFGKSEGKALWLDAGMTPPHAFYNFWVNSDDRDVEKYLQMFTFKSRGDIARLMTQHAANPGARVPHHALALELTERVHGAAIAKQTADGVRGAFASRESATLPELIEQVLTTVPAREFRWDPTKPPKVEDVLVAGGLASSKGEARRGLAGKGLYINREVLEAGSEVPSTFLVQTRAGKFLLLQKGKKTYQPLKITGLD